MTFTSIGQLNERVTLQSESRTEDGGGGYLSIWLDVATLWAAVTPLGGAEAPSGEQLTGHGRYRFTIRDRGESAPSPTTAMRLVWRNAALNIRAITRNVGADLLDLTAEDGVAT